MSEASAQSAAAKFIDIIVVPTYNEIDNIGVLIERVFAQYPHIHLLVVDDNSADGTGVRVRELQDSYPNLRLLLRPRKLGFSSAYRDAFKQVLGEIENLRAVVTMDTDLSHDPAAIGAMLEKIDSYDMVIGSRYVPGGGAVNWSLPRRLLSRFGNFYARIVTGTPIRDLTTGFVCYRADVLRRMDRTPLVAKGFAALIEMKIVCARGGARMLEIPIVFTERAHGHSKLSPSIVVEGLVVPWRLSRFAKVLDRRSGNRRHGRARRG